MNFDQIPSNLRIPRVSVEFDATQADQGSALLPQKALIIGQKTSAGSAAANSVHRITSDSEVRALAGPGSMLHRMCKKWFANCKSVDTYVGVLEDASGTSDTRTITITGTATAAGTLSLYVGGDYYPIPVEVDDDGSDVAAAIHAAIDEDDESIVTAGSLEGVATLTYRNDGNVGNALDVRLNYASGDETPAGLTVVVATGVTGATNPDISTLLANLGDEWYTIIVHPYAAVDAIMDDLEVELEDRASALRMIDAIAISAAVGSVGTLETLGNGRNCEFSVIISPPGGSCLTLPAEYAAACAGVIVPQLQNDPGRPLTSLKVSDLVISKTDKFTDLERNSILFDGVATTRTDDTYSVYLERIITTYQKTDSGASSSAYLDINVPAILSYLRYTWRNLIATKYSRHKLAQDGTRFGPGQAVVTPSVIKAEALSWFRSMESLGLVQDFDMFKANLIVEQNAIDLNRIDTLLPPKLIGQLISVATKIQFRK